MAFVNKNDLSSFANKLKNYKANNGLAQKVINLVANKGKQLANENWNNEVIVSIDGDNLKKTIIASDKNKVKPTIAYKEFGTGVAGEGTYDGNLPTQTISFTDSKGTMWKTKGWEYHYRYNQTKQGKPFKGQIAKHPMFTTSKQLRAYIKNDLIKDIKREV